MRARGLSDLALSRPVTVGMLLLALALLGAIGILRLPLAFLPTENSARVFVRADAPATTPEILEREVVRPLEEQVAGMRDLQKIQVGTGSWGVRINLEFRPGTDIDARKLELRERLDRVRGTLPTTVQRIEVGSYSMMDDPVMELQIASDLDLTREYYLIEQHVVRMLERIRGVSRVELEGVARYELEIALDPEALERAGVDPGDVSRAVTDARQGRSLGRLRGSAQDPGVRSPSAPAEASSYSALPIGRRRHRAADALGETERAHLGEVARLDAHPEEQRGGRRLDGRPAIGVEIFTAAGASTVEVTREVRAAIDRLRADPALAGVEVLVFHDQGEMILTTLGDLRNTGVWGGALGVLVLLGFLHRWRTTLAAAVTIPMSVLAAFAVLFLRGDELNCIVLLGLVLGVGMFIDNAVVIVESIEQQMQRGLTAIDAARLGARDVGLATIASTLSTVIVFLPLVVDDPTDPMSAYLRPLGITFSIALISSLVVSQLGVPLLMGRVLRPDPKPVAHPIVARLAAAYARGVSATLRWPRRALVLALLVAATSVIPARQLNLRLGQPEEKPDHLPVRLQVAGSRGHEAIGQHVETMEAALLARRDALRIRNLACSYRDWGGNCRVYPVDAFESEGDLERFEEDVRGALPEQAGVTYRLGERDGHWSENRDRKVVDFALKGEDMGVLMELAEQVGEHLRSALPQGSADDPEAGGYDLVTTPFSEGSKEIAVVLEPDRLRSFGLGAGDVAQAVSLAFQGLRVGRTLGAQGEIALRLSAVAPAGVAGLERLRDLRLRTPGGQEVPLAAVARLEQVASPHWLQRVDRQTEVRVQVRFFGTDSEANWAAVTAAMATFSLPAGVTWGRGSQWWKEKEAGNEMLVNLALCLMLVYAVMASLFENVLQPLAILGTCLLGCFGAPWALWVTGTTVDTTALIGLFILIGVIVNNGIMLVDKVTQLRREGMPRELALATAGRERLRPVLMTATTTILGLVPMLIHHPTLAGIYYHSIAIVITGGLATSTIVTLVFLPAAYVWTEDLALAIRWRWRWVAHLGPRRPPPT